MLYTLQYTYRNFDLKQTLKWIVSKSITFSGATSDAIKIFVYVNTEKFLLSLTLFKIGKFNEIFFSVETVQLFQWYAEIQHTIFDDMYFHEYLHLRKPKLQLKSF